MNKLLTANFSRLIKDKVFWLGVATMLILSAIIMFTGYREISDSEQLGYTLTIDDYFFNLVPAFGLFYAIFISLFLGTDYSDGTIRNKLIVGHTRTHIYLANFVTCFVAGLFFLVAWLIGSLVGLPMLGFWQMGIQGFAVYVLVAIFFTLAFTGIFTLLSTLSTNKAITAVIAILLFLGLIIAASMTYNRLQEPEFNNNVVLTMDGLQSGEATPNPNYISGSVRTVYEFTLDLLPTGQGILMSNLEITHPIRQISSSLLITLCTVLGGILVFRRKDLK